jgi:predicted house-cleaning NTP pyrophosphatase (Maf/HAM1 superfamily)
MNRETIDFQQFSLAPRKKSVAEDTNESLLAIAAGEKTADTLDHAPRPADRETVLPRLADEERRRRSAKLATEQDDTRRRLKSLKRAKDRAIKFYVNVPLEQEAKERLLRAAHENDVKMTVIMQAAIDTYLKDNGY